MKLFPNLTWQRRSPCLHLFVRKLRNFSDNNRTAVLFCYSWHLLFSFIVCRPALRLMCNNVEITIKTLKTYTHNRLTAFFRDHPGEPVPEENFWTLWCKGRLTDIHIMYYKTKTESVSLSCKSHRSKTANVKIYPQILSTDATDHILCQSVSCHKCTSAHQQLRWAAVWP